MKDLDMFVTVQLLEDTPAVLSLGKLCEESGSYGWKEGRTPNLMRTGKIALQRDNFMPVVVPGSLSDRNISGSADDSAENTAKVTPDDEERTRASIDRWQYLPEWLEEFAGNLVEPRSTSSGSDNKDLPEPPRPKPLPSDKPEGKHILCTHFPNGPNCQICKRTQITKAACTRNSKSHTPHPIKFGDIITADYKILNEEFRNNQRYAVVVQDLATQRIRSYPYKPQTSQETVRNLRNFRDPEEKPKVMIKHGQHWNLEQLVKIFDGMSVRTHLIGLRRMEWQGRAVRRVKAGLDDQSWADSLECCCRLRNVQDLSAEEKTPHEQRFVEPFSGPIIPSRISPDINERSGKAPSVQQRSPLRHLCGLCSSCGKRKLERRHTRCRRRGVARE